jgi:hypothetical protein
MSRKNKDKNMKSNRTHLIRSAGTTLALAVILGFAGSVQAQYAATGADGVTASPKTRQLLSEQAGNHSVAAVPVAAAPMACSICKDKLTTRIDSTARGANKPAIQVTTHLCGTCGTDWKVTGVGKAKQAAASHSCGSCAVAKD